MADKALIIGCGRIAGGFNEDRDDAVLTHVVAYRQLGVQVVGCCDRDAERAARFARRWQIAHHDSDLQKILSVTQPEIVSVCTPPDARLEIMKTVLAAPSVRSVLVEKPLAATGAEAREIQALAGQAKRPVLVNFSRALDPFYQKLAAEFQRGDFGRFCNGTARYYGGAAVNAVHWLERALALFGAPVATRRLSGGDDQPAFELDFREGRMIFLPTDGCQYSPFELDLLFEKNRVRVIDSERRVEYFTAQPDPNFSGYFNLAPSPSRPGTAPSHETLLLAVKAALDAASGDAPGWRDLLQRSVTAMEIIEQVGNTP